MKKKEIEKVPFHRGVRADREYINTAVAFLQDIKDEQHLFVEVYENKRRERKIPWIRMVFTQKDWGLYYPDKGVWSAADLQEEEKRIGCRVKRKSSQCYMAKAQKDMIWAFAGDTWRSVHNNWLNALQGLIWDIKCQRTRKRDEARAERLRERKRNTPPLPEGLEGWTGKAGFEHFLYYRRKGRYVEIACSACGQVTEAATERKETFEGQFEKIIPIPRHNSAGICPNCGVTGTYKAQGKTKGAWGKGINCFVAQKYKGNGVVVRYIEAEKIYTLKTALEDEKEIMTGAGEKMIVTEIARTYLEEGKKPQTDYHKYSTVSGDFWDDCNICGMNQITIRPARVYPGSYTELRDTFLKYSAAEIYGKDRIAYNLKEYLERYFQWPRMEMLVKMGLYQIVESMVRHECGIIADSGAMRPEDFLGIRRERLKDLQIMHGNLDYLRIWQIERRRGLRLTTKECVFLAESRVNEDDLEEILKYTTVTKFMHRVEQYSGCEIPESWLEPMCAGAAGVLSSVTRTYTDYLHMRIQRGYDLHNQIFLFPRDLQLAHDRMVVETNTEEIKKREQEVGEKYPDIQKNYRHLRNRYFYEDEDFLIRPARSAGEIVLEGRILHHCVGGDSYLDRHNTGRSTILFLRSKLAPEVPYITIEICGTKIRQWYGIRDTKPDEARVEAYLRKYIEALKERNQIMATA